MYYEVICGPGMSMARVLMDRGERFWARPGGMVGMSEEAGVVTRFWGNPLLGLQRRLTGCGGFLGNQFRGLRHGAEVLLASGKPGGIEAVEVRGRGLMVQPRALLGAGPGVGLRGAWAGLAAVMTGEGGFFLRCRGEGVVLVSGFGGMHMVELVEGEVVVVERGCVLAYDRSVRFTAGRMGTLVNALLMRRLLTGHFRGPGRVLVQTRNEGYFGRWLAGNIPEWEVERDVNPGRTV